MHTIDTEKVNLRTDLISEQKIEKKDLVTRKFSCGEVENLSYQDSTYTAITFDDITDSDNYQKVLDVFVEELKKYIDLKSDDKILVVGLGNENSTPDALGPKTLDNVLVTRPFFLMGDVDPLYSNVSKFKPSVMGETGIETKVILKSIIKDSGANKVIVIDALKASKVHRLNRVIQITDSGIWPGSGINNNRGEVSHKTMGVDIIAIGVPTVVDVLTIVKDILEEDVSLKENLIVTPTNIDFMIEKLALLIGHGINIVLHKDFKRQNNY